MVNLVVSFVWECKYIIKPAPAACLTIELTASLINFNLRQTAPKENACMCVFTGKVQRTVEKKNNSLINYAVKLVYVILWPIVPACMPGQTCYFSPTYGAVTS